MACEKTDAKLRLLTVLSICLCLPPTTGFAQSLRDLAKQAGGKATSGWDMDLPVAQIPELLSESDLVVQGRIVEARVHLGPDELYVFTDLVIPPIRFIKKRRPRTTARPGETTEIVIRRLGGRLIENGLEMATGVNIYPESESFKVAGERGGFLRYEVRRARHFF